MFKQLVGPLLIWLMAIISQTANLGSTETIRIFGRSISKKQLATFSMIGVATLALAWQFYQANKTEREINNLKTVVAVSNSKLFNEASGGTAIKDLAYIVDDEKPGVFVFRLRKDLYELIDRIELKENGKILTGDDLDDLEAVASSPDGKLYLITSYSNTGKGKVNLARQRLLEVSLDPDKQGEITDSAKNLRASILNKLTGDHLADSYRSKEGYEEVVQIEGFTIDEQGFAYLGLRAPLDKEGYALVLRAPLSDLFSKEKEPQFTVFRLDLRQEDDKHEIVHYGIVSLNYDVQSRSLLIVGNAPDNSDYYTPVLCQWEFAGEHKDERFQHPTQCSPLSYQASGSTPNTSKIELLLLPPASVSDRIFMFLDTDDKGDGGQFSLTRSELGFSEVKDGSIASEK